VTTILPFGLFEWSLRVDRQDILKWRNERALGYLADGRPGKAIPLYKRTLADCQRLQGPGHSSTLRAQNNLAMCYRAAGRTAEAISLLERTVAGCQRALGANHPDTRTARDNLATCYRAGGSPGDESRGRPPDARARSGRR